MPGQRSTATSTTSQLCLHVIGPCLTANKTAEDNGSYLYNQEADKRVLSSVCLAQKSTPADRLPSSTGKQAAELRPDADLLDLHCCHARSSAAVTSCGGKPLKGSVHTAAPHARAVHTRRFAARCRRHVHCDSASNARSCGWVPNDPSWHTCR